MIKKINKTQFDWMWKKLGGDYLSCAFNSEWFIDDPSITGMEVSIEAETQPGEAEININVEGLLSFHLSSVGNIRLELPTIKSNSLETLRITVGGCLYCIGIVDLPNIQTVILEGERGGRFDRDTDPEYNELTPYLKEKRLVRIIHLGNLSVYVKSPCQNPHKVISIIQNHLTSKGWML